MSQAEAQGFWFVCRSRLDGPLSKRIRRIEAPSILTWFQWQIDDARTSAAPRKVGEAQLGGCVRDLASLFEAAKDKVLHTPRTSVALRKMFREELRGSSDAESILVEDHSVRVLCQADDPVYAYYFFDDEAVREAPSQYAWLLHDEAQLPDGESSEPYVLPVAVRSMAPEGDGAGGAVYACFFSSHRKISLPAMVVRIEGVSLSGLAPHLRLCTPERGTDGAPWPVELRLLRALVEEGDRSVGPALQRATAFSLVGVPDQGTLGTGAQADAKAEFVKAAEAFPLASDPAKSVVGDGAHVAWMFAHVSDELGYRQWILFDEAWAAAHTELATSLLRLAESWDPCARLKAPRASKTEPRAKATKRRTPAKRSDSSPTGAAGLRAPRTATAAKERAAWTEGLAGRGESDAIPYRPTLRFAQGEAVLHKKFGLGFVSRAELTNCEVTFADGTRLLAHGLGL